MSKQCNSTIFSSYSRNFNASDRPGAGEINESSEYLDKFPLLCGSLGVLCDPWGTAPGEGGWGGSLEVADWGFRVTLLFSYLLGSIPIIDPRVIPEKACYSHLLVAR